MDEFKLKINLSAKKIPLILYQNLKKINNLHVCVEEEY
jgi:hypothetical protein